MDQKNLLAQAIGFLQSQQRHRRWLQVVTAMAAMVVFVTTYLLILPAITMNHNAIQVEAEKSALPAGAAAEVTIQATAHDQWEQTVFVLAADGTNAGLDETQVSFDQDNTATVTDTAGNLVTLYRQQGSGGVFYYFLLDQNRSATFTLPWINGITTVVQETQLPEVLTTAGLAQPEVEPTGAVEETVTEEIPAETAEETPAEEPIQEPAVEEPAQEEPTTEEAPAAEPVKEEAPVEEAAPAAEPEPEPQQEVQPAAQSEESAPAEPVAASAAPVQKETAQEAAPAAAEPAAQSEPAAQEATQSEPAAQEAAPASAPNPSGEEEAGPAAQSGSVTLYVGSGQTLEEANESIANATEPALTLSWEEVQEADIATLAEDGVEPRADASLNDYLTRVVMQDANGNVVSQLNPGEEYSVTLWFSESSSRQFTSPMTYQLPAGLTIPKKQSGTIYQNGVAVGTYNIGTDGTLTVTFNDSFLTGYNDGAFNLSFDASVSSSGTGSGGDNQISFPGGTSFDVVVPTTELQTGKSGSFKLNEGSKTEGTISYTVTATAKNGAVNGLVITDTITPDANCIYNAATNFKVQVDGADVESDKYQITTAADGSFVVNFAENYTLPADQTLTITYDVPVTLPEDSNTSINQRNEVKVSGNAANGTDEPPESTSSTTVYVSANNEVQKYVSKWGTAVVTPGNAQENELGKIQWEVTVVNGDGLAGATVTDTLGEGLTWDGQDIVMTYTDENGQTQTLFIPASQVTYNTETNQLTFSLPTKNSQGADIDYTSAKLTYSTTYDLDKVPQNGSASYTNSATATDGDSGEIGSSGDVSVNVPGVQTTPTTTTKEVTANGDTLHYEVQVTVPALAGGYTPFYVEDYMSFQGATQFEGQASWLVLNDGCIQNLTVTGLPDGTTYQQAVENNRLYLYFNGTSVEDSKWTYDTADVTFTISYDVSLSDLAAANPNIGLLDGISEGGTLRNTAINHFFQRTSQASDSYKEQSYLTKTGQVNDDGTITYTVDLLGLDAAARQAIYASGAAYFVDDLPDGWTYQSGSLVAWPLYAGNTAGRNLPWQGEASSLVIDGVLRANFSDFKDWDDLFSLIDPNASGQSALNGLRFTYTLKKDSTSDNYDVEHVHNSAYIEWAGGHKPDADCTVDYSQNPLTKTAVVDKTNKGKVTFTIEVNPLKADLLSGDYLTLEDSMDGSLNFDITSLKIVDGNTNAAVTGWGVNVRTEDGKNILTLTGVPDNRYLKITYDVYATESGNFSNTVSLNGKASWEMKEEVTVEEGSSSAEATGSTGKFYLHKVDSETGESVSGAKFKLYLVGPKQLDPTLESDAGISGLNVAVPEGLSGYSYCYDLTQKDDTFLWALENHPGWYQIGNKGTENQETSLAVEMFAAAGYRFVLVEESAPDGYQASSAPIILAYGDGNYTPPGGGNTVPYGGDATLVGYGGTVTVENTPLTKVSVQKEWQGTSGSEIQVALMQVAHYRAEVPVTPTEYYTLTVTGGQNPQEYQIGKGATVYLYDNTRYSGTIQLNGSDGTSKTADIVWNQSLYCMAAEFTMDRSYTYAANNEWSTVTVTSSGSTEWQDLETATAIATATLNQGNGWSHTWSNLTLPSNGTVTVDGQELECTYTYRVVERTGGEWTVTYTVNGTTYTECPQITGTTNVIITNTSTTTSPGYELPETGGPGTLWYTIGGLALMGLALLMYKHRRGKGDETS